MLDHVVYGLGLPETEYFWISYIPVNCSVVNPATICVARSTVFRSFSNNSAPVCPPRALNSPSIAIAVVRMVAKIRDNPLAHIARQVQCQIADGVFVLATA